MTTGIVANELIATIIEKIHCFEKIIKVKE